jgi:hypothetical protein
VHCAGDGNRWKVAPIGPAFESGRETNKDAHTAGEALTVKQVPHPRDVATAPGLLARSDVTLSDADHRRE